ncbi:MAG: hypothetical protein U0936_01830 [Planctomycetaceae bacterium]
MIGKVLEDAASEMGRSRVPAVLFLGDGRQAASGAMNVDPVQVARLYGRQQRAIFPPSCWIRQHRSVRCQP